MASTDMQLETTGHLHESKNLFRNLSRLSRKKPEIILPKIIMSELLIASESSDSAKEPDFINNSECNSEAHEWKQLVNIILPVNVESLRKALFTPSKFIDDLHEMRKHVDASWTEWERNDDGELQRTIKYKMPLATTMGFGPKYSSVTQIQTENSCCIPNRLYAVDVVNSNENIPYADVFDVLVHHCLTATIDDHSMYSVYGQIRYKKSVWGVVKSRIDKNCAAGMEEFFGHLQSTLQKKFCTPPSKGKRSSKRMSTMSTRKHSSALLIQPLVNKIKPQTLSSMVKETLEPTILIWLIFGILVAVISLNTVLLFKLWSLEEELSPETLPNYDLLRSTHRSSDEWINLLSNQRNIREAEILKWQRVLEIAIELIQNTEKTLVELMGQIQLQDIVDHHSKDKSHPNLQTVSFSG